MRHSVVLVLVCVAPVLHAQDFERDVAPILVKRCLECHSGADPKGKLDLTTRTAALKGGKNGPALVPGNLDDSELWVRVETGQMPPKKPLSAEEKKHLQAWIKSGANWAGPALDGFARSTDTRAGFDWWSLQPVKRAETPRVQKAAWVRNPIDAFLLARLEEKGLAPAAEADRRTLIRRVTFDLLGLPPSPRQVQDFLQDDRVDAYDRLVDELLASPHYGERWARHWLDVVRFAESHGFEHDELRKSSWPYRDWVIQALNRDMPYDEFVRLQIAGDILKPGADGLRATGFLVAGGYDSVGQRQQSVVMRAVVRQDELEDMVGTLGQTFLGLTVHCARCHDHKFDPIRQVEYYRLSAALAGVRHGERDVVEVADTVAEQRAAKARAELDQLEAKHRALILAQRNKGEPAPGPQPLAHWDFTKGLEDRIGKLHAKVYGDAVQTAAGLRLTGKGYAATEPLDRDLKARTLSVWVKLDNLQQRGGAAMSVQKLDGTAFDAIVFAEKEPGKWLAGSDFFRRSLDFGGPVETRTEPVHLAFVYQADGSIAAFRNGTAHGKATKPPGPITYSAGQSQILFGLRHSPPGANKHLTGVITRAELFDRALAPAEIAALSGTSSNYVSEQELLSRLSSDEQTRRVKLLADIAAVSQSVQTRSKVYAVAPAPPETTHLLRRGEPNNKGEEVVAAGLAAVGKADFDLKGTASDAERRRKLAEWITSPTNPLLARVLVNRLWHYHFGQGIVDTPSDFGFSGGRPSHPELLDWLAAELMKQGWSMKKMHRLLVTSAAYRQSSRFDPAAAKLDAQNRLLWRKSPMRLEAEAARDAVLTIAGKLNPRMFGPGYQDFKLSVRGATHYYLPSEGDNDEQLRRSIYRTWVRSGRNPLLDTLDCPDPSTVTPRRSVTTTPLQSLTLLNSDFMLRMADTFAARLQAEAGKDIARQIQRGYELALGRSPRREEVTLAERVVAEHGLSILCRALLNCNEFMYVD